MAVTGPLFQLHTDIESRVGTIRDEHPDWLCRKGCDACCRRLAEIPRLTAAEWRWLSEGLAGLPQEQLAGIGEAVEVMATQPARQVVCPFLDSAAGACRVYVHRPVACRTYGFYVERDQGLYCKDIEARVDAGDLINVVWGNQESVDRQLRDMGEVRALNDWFAAWRAAGKAD